MIAAAGFKIHNAKNKTVTRSWSFSLYLTNIFVYLVPENLNVGQCLVGGCKITRLIVVNEGGPGRFCVMKRDQWPASNFKVG